MKDRVLCIPVTTHTLYQSQTHYDLSMFMAINFCVFCQKHELLDIKKRCHVFA